MLRIFLNLSTCRVISYYAPSQKLRKMTDSSFTPVRLSVSLSSWNNSTTTGQILIQFDILCIFRICVEKIQFSLKSDNNDGYCTWTPIYIDLSKYQLSAHSLNIQQYKLRYTPQHVSSSTLLTIRRTNCITTASGIVTLCKQPYSMRVESSPPAYCTAAYRGWRY